MTGSLTGCCCAEHGPAFELDGHCPNCPVHEPLKVTVRIVPATCTCGGNLAWMGQRTSGSYEMIGCVCCSTPERLVGVDLTGVLVGAVTG